jgi:NAD(P)-dependent dehydrogenase (short-subunit alcohol dehydrogenase family)
MKESPVANTTGPHAGLLAGKVAIITGASRGIGAVAARTFAAAGAAVVLAARDTQALDVITRAIQADGGEALAVPTDVSDPSAVQHLVEEAVRAFGRLDVAFNNAAGGGQGPTLLADLPVEAYDSALTISLRGVFLSLKYEIPAILAAGGGAIVNMASTAGVEGVGGVAGYVSAKHGVIGLTRSAALDYAGRNLRVNAVAPGPIFTEHLAAAGAEAQRMAGLAMPMQRIGRPDEVARAVVWLCSEQASFITGAVLPIDGGKLAGMAPFRPVGRSTAG